MKGDWRDVHDDGIRDVILKLSLAHEKDCTRNEGWAYCACSLAERLRLLEEQIIGRRFGGQL
jgi:hypothetical protein